MHPQEYLDYLNVKELRRQAKEMGLSIEQTNDYIKKNKNHYKPKEKYSDDR